MSHEGAPRGETPQDSLAAQLAVLDLPADASPGEVRRAYRDLIKVWHPDRFPAAEARVRARAEAKLREINGAYEWLCDHFEALASGSPSRETTVLVRCTKCSAPGHLSYPLPEALYTCRRCGSVLRVRLTDDEHIEVSLVEAGRDEEAAPATPPRPAALAARPVAHGVDWGARGLAALALGAVLVVALIVIERGSPVRQAAPSPAPAAVPEGPTFTLGDPQARVLAAQGAPTSVVGSSWRYDFSFVKFESGRVVGYANTSRNLRVRLGRTLDGSLFEVGSTRAEVVAAQGTPTSVIGDTWQYEDSTVQFDGQRVASVDNAGGNLRLQ